MYVAAFAFALQQSKSYQLLQGKKCRTSSCTWTTASKDKTKCMNVENCIAESKQVLQKSRKFSCAAASQTCAELPGLALAVLIGLSDRQ